MRLGKVEQELAVQVHRNRELKRDHEGLVSLVDSLVERLGAETDERVFVGCSCLLSTTNDKFLDSYAKPSWSNDHGGEDVAGFGWKRAVLFWRIRGE
jgi:hypothetical protein